VSKSPGTCVFCGGTGLTKSHVGPDFMNRILPTDATHHDQEIGKFYTFEPKVPGPDYSKQRRQGRAGSRKPRNTCLACNTGWMSTIESNAMPYMERLIQGQAFLLNTFGQRQVAALLVLITMRLEFLSTVRVAKQSERDWLREHLSPTETWKIWIGRYGGARGEENWRMCYAQLGPKPTDTVGGVGGDFCNLLVTTMVFGQLFTHLGYSSVTDFPGYDGLSLYRLWPPGPFDLDTYDLPSMSDQDVLRLHEAFARETKPMPGGGAPERR
jgi:hypothetical protein